MTWVQTILAALEARLWKFVRAIISANHDYPYHDFIFIDNSESEEDLAGIYVVGTSNINAHGDQTKRFVSKHTNIWSDFIDNTVKFNDSRNVDVYLPIRAVDTVETMAIYEKEFHTNISSVHYNVVAGQRLWMYFEGVLPEEARDAE